MKKKVLSIVLASVMAVATGITPMSIFAGETETAEKHTSSKDTLNIVTNNDHGNVNSAESIGDNSQVLISLCTNYLFDYYRDGNAIDYGVCDRSLAEDYKMDDDNLGVTINLREGVKFQNGTDFTAEDAKFSFNFFKNYSGMEFVDFDNIEARDENTLYIPFTKVYSGALTKVGYIPMWSEKYFEEVGEDTSIFFHDAPIGTGAYQITEYIKDDHVNLSAFDDYFQGTPLIKNINLRFISEPTVRFSELETGGCDYLYTLTGSDIQAMDSGDYEGQLEMYQQPMKDAFALGFNGYSDIWQDIRVRQAFCYAIDRHSCVTAYDGSGDDMWTILANDGGKLTEFKDDDWFYPYDPEKAAALLDEAGFVDTDGDGMREKPDGSKFTIRFLYLGVNPTYATVGEILKNNLAQVGVDFEMKGYDVGTYDEAMRNDVKDWDLLEMNFEGPTTAKGWDITPEVYMVAYVHADQFDSWNDYTKTWIEPLDNEVDQDKFWDKFHEFEQHILTDYLYYYPVVKRLDSSAYTVNLKGFDRISCHTINAYSAYFE